MMKFVFALVVLLHFCYSYNLNITLNGEIIKRLETLNNLYRVNKANITLVGPMHEPSNDMNTNAYSCVSVFVRELKHLLDYVNVHEESEYILLELKANLEALDPHQQIDHKCQMVPSRKSLKPFQPYVRFLRKLNTSTKR